MKAGKLIAELLKLDGDIEVFGVSVRDSELYVNPIEGFRVCDANYADGDKEGVAGAFLGSDVGLSMIDDSMDDEAGVTA